ncbi:MAG: penicillin-binding protein 1C, partial [Deltaproteobacteria bacterium]|nr:penicillin-binding protein 1C [Deltaproteobacteria bacterium]
MAALGALLAFWAALGAFPDPLATAEWPWTVNIVDRHYRPLAKIPGPNGYRDAKELADFSPTLIAAVLAAEDRRFYWHLGFDPLAAARALGQNLAAQKVVRGGSTVTAQLARLSLGLYPGPRTLRRKLKEFWTALLIERHHDKDEILAAYLNAVPTGPFRWGLATAARDYLGKDAALLSPAEAAFLAALPKNPNQTDLDKLRNRQKWILGRLKDQGFLSEADRQRALVEALSPISPQNPYLAPHFVARLRQAATAAAGPKANPGQPLRSSLDLELQTQAQRLVSETVAAWSRQGLTQAAVVVLSLPDREVLAWVGSADFFDRAEGQNDGVLALRQPGSALKPFIYQQALEEGLITAATLLNDEPTSYDGGVGSFTPRNYGEGFHGRIPARVALASSLNVPAVQLLNALGPGKAIRRLNSLGFSFKEDADLYGLGLTLGAGEVSLLALTNAYATLALGGRDGQPTFRPGPENPAGSLDLDPGASFIVNHILADDEARAVGFGRRGVLATSYPSSVKTGTSQNFRDNWAVGFTDGFIVGVWAGNFQARPMSEVSGVTGAGRLWRRLADYLAQKKPPKPLKVPPGVVKASVCPITGLLKGPNCPNGVSEYFLAQSLPPGVCDHDHEPNAGRGLRPSPPPVFASSQSPALMAQWLSP